MARFVLAIAVLVFACVGLAVETLPAQARVAARTVVPTTSAPAEAMSYAEANDAFAATVCAATTTPWSRAG